MRAIRSTSPQVLEGFGRKTSRGSSRELRICSGIEAATPKLRARSMAKADSCASGLPHSSTENHSSFPEAKPSSPDPAVHGSNESSISENSSGFGSLGPCKTASKAVSGLTRQNFQLLQASETSLSLVKRHERVAANFQRSRYMKNIQGACQGFRSVLRGQGFRSLEQSG